MRGISSDAAKGQMMMLLANATAPRLAALTVEGLMASYRVDRKTAEYHLTMARQRARERGQ